jgi:hypothetical protein
VTSKPSPTIAVRECLCVPSARTRHYEGILSSLAKYPCILGVLYQEWPPNSPHLLLKFISNLVQSSGFYNFVATMHGFVGYKEMQLPKNQVPGCRFCAYKTSVLAPNSNNFHKLCTVFYFPKNTSK